MAAPIDQLAAAAVEPVEDGMIVGLGTGRAAARGIQALADKARRHNLAIKTVATSHRSADLARSLGLTVLPMRDVESVDYLFDGADEVAPDMTMLKGGGGAMTREKIVAHAAKRRAYLVQDEKLVPHLGTRMPLPVEFLDFGAASVRRRLARLGLEGDLRAEGDGTYNTDNGNPVLDLMLKPEHDLMRMNDLLDAIPGVVGHGLFMSEADDIWIESETGDLRRMAR